LLKSLNPLAFIFNQSSQIPHQSRLLQVLCFLTTCKSKFAISFPVVFKMWRSWRHLDI